MRLYLEVAYLADEFLAEYKEISRIKVAFQREEIFEVIA